MAAHLTFDDQTATVDGGVWSTAREDVRELLTFLNEVAEAEQVRRALYVPDPDLWLAQFAAEQLGGTATADPPDYVPGRVY